MTIAAVIFDFGGVLVRAGDAPGRRRWEQRLGLAEGTLANMVFHSEVAVRSSIGEVPESAIWQDVGERLGLSDEDRAQLQRDFWLGEYLDAELIALMRELRPTYKIALLSNAWLGARQVFSERFKLDQEVDFMIISAEERLAKPDVRIYDLAAQRLGIRPEQAIFVDDLAENIEGARVAGMIGVHFQNSAQVIAEIRSHLDGAYAQH